MEQRSPPKLPNRQGPCVSVRVWWGGRKAFYDAFAFPRDDMDRAEERTVRVRLLIEADGAVEVQEVVQSSGVFAIDRAVVETITSLEWEPGTEDGEPVPVRMTIPFVLRTSP